MTVRWTWHGGGLSAARAHFGDGDWLDLSTGVNPSAWPGVDAISPDWRALPDELELRELELAAAAHFGCSPENLCALPGAEIGLRALGDLIPPPMFYVAPSYRTYGEAMKGAAPIRREAMGRADGATLVLANPNNPDGRLLDRDALRRLLAGRGRDGWLVLDEAFCDVHPEQSLASSVADHLPLLIFRSFGKFFGLAGLRLGFLLGPRPLVDRMREKLGAWPVSAGAISIGRRAYADRPWVSAMREKLAREARALDDMLNGLGYRTVGDCPLFRLLVVDDAQRLFERLARRLILTRPFDYDPHWLRIGLLGEPAAFARLKLALQIG